jgi:hypothetical protein
LREGGSLPAIIEADDDGMYVLKFRGAGQGPKALIAELIAGEIARAAGLLVPEIVFVELDPELARTEPDPEIQDLIRASAGLNLALDYLPGAVTFDPVVEKPDSDLASSVVWFDAFVTNVDRTPRNTNMLMWHRRLWLIDHGAAFYFHHKGSDFLERSQDPFKLVKDHTLLRFANDLQAVDTRMAGLLTPDVIMNVVKLIPDAWLPDARQPEARLEADPSFGGDPLRRDNYAKYMLRRLENRRVFLKEAIDARSLHL